jgi:DNA-binding MarR family transcriptional regulator
MSSRTGDVGATTGSLRRALRRQALADARFLAAVASHLGLSDREALALDHLTEDGPLTAGDLARRLHLSPSGASALVHRLEVTGHIVRCGDRRGAPLRATSHAIYLLAAARAPLESEIDDLSAVLAPARRDEVTRFLQAAATAAERAADRLAADARRRALDALAAPELPQWG